MDLLGTDFPFNTKSLSGKHALVCGASKGIGRATALVMAKCGANVTVASRDLDALNQLVSEMNELGKGDHSSIGLDLEDTDEIRISISNLLKQKGNVHILVNNAGGPPGGPLLQNNVDEFEAPFKRHLHASHTLVQLLSDGMESDGYGRILQIISTSVKEPIPNIGLSNTLRGAMASWAKSLSRELHPSITINNILPGFTNTERLGSLSQSIQSRTGKSADEVQEGWLSQVPIGRLIDPLETACALTYLALPAAGGIRGVSLAVDGGRLRSI